MELDAKDDLQPMFSSALFQCTLCAGLDVDSADDEPFLNRALPSRSEDRTSADCSAEFVATEAGGSCVPVCADEVAEVHRNDSAEVWWMACMDDAEEWFGLKDQPLAIPVFCDVTQPNLAYITPTYVPLEPYDGGED